MHILLDLCELMGRASKQLGVEPAPSGFVHIAFDGKFVVMALGFDNALKVHDLAHHGTNDAHLKHGSLQDLRSRLFPLGQKLVIIGFNEPALLIPGGFHPINTRVLHCFQIGPHPLNW